MLYIIEGTRMKEIEEALNKKQVELGKLQREVDTLRAALGIMREQKNHTKPEIIPRSQPQMAAAVLEAAGNALHVGDIATQLDLQFGKKVAKQNLGVLLYRYAQRGKLFYKDTRKPNTYGLIKWRLLPHQQEKREVVQ